MMTSSEKVALQVFQQGISALAKLTDDKVQLDFEFQSLEEKEQKAIDNAKDILGWTEKTEINTLGLLFDHIKLEKNKPSQKHYHQLRAIDHKNQEYPEIPYPLDSEPAATEITAFQERIKQEVLPILADNWENLSFLMLILEKYGSCLSFGEKNIALVDMVKSTAGIAATLVNNSQTENISLVVGDLSGIQKFIYTISSSGALKSLRARSFYLELVTEEVVQQLLDQLKLTRTNVIYAGGGNLYILADSTDETKKIVARVRTQFNEWLLKEFQGK